DNSGSLSVDVFRIDTYNVCLKDDFSGDLLRVNSLTGAYSFTRAGPGGFTITGTGVARPAAVPRCSLLTATHSQTNAYAIDLRSTIDLRLRTGSATIKVTPGGTFSITDRNIDDSLCVCR